MPRKNARSPSALDTHLGFWLRMVSNQVSVEFARSIMAQGVSVSEWVALRRLLDAPAEPENARYRHSVLSTSRFGSSARASLRTFA